MVLHAKPLEKLWAISSWCHFRRFWCSRSIQSSPTRTQLHRRVNISQFESNFTWARIFGAETSLTKSRTFFAITSRLNSYVSFSCLSSISTLCRACAPRTPVNNVTVDCRNIDDTLVSKEISMLFALYPL